MRTLNLPEDWAVLSFASCLKKVKSKKVSSIPQKNYHESGEFPVIDQGATFIAGWTDSVESVIFDNLPVVIFGDHTRIFKYVDFPFAMGADGTKLLYANDDLLDTRFFYYALLNLNLPNKGYNRHYRYLREFSVVCPPPPQQRAIVHVLQTIQEAKAARQRELALERERKAALMDYLFSHGTKGEPRKQTEIGEIPESWEVVRLGEATEIIMGQSPKGDTYNTDGEGEPLINGPAEFGPEYPTLVQWTSKPTKLCKDGDILFCVRGNTTGRMNIADQRYCIGRGIAAIRERSQKSNTLFIRNILEYERSSLYRIAIGGGSTFPNISTVHLKNYTIALPSVSEQAQIAEILQACDTKIAALEQEAERLDELFHAMLHELMTGQRSAVPLIDSELLN